jgi:ethanolamine kinase
LCRFHNGHAYEFLDGTVCSERDISKAQIWRGVARELAKWHAVLPTAGLSGTDKKDAMSKPSVWSKAEKWLGALPSSTEEQRLKKQTLQDEYRWLKPRLTGIHARDAMVSVSRNQQHPMTQAYV